MAANGNNREIVAALLAAGKSVVDAAAESNTGERTIHRWLEDRTFKERVSELRGAAIARALGRLTDGMTQAADALRELLNSESEPVRLRAAAEILKSGSDLRRTIEQERRIEEINERLRNIEADKKPK